MAIRFIIDNKLREEQKSISEILALTKKQPYSTKEAVHLARFVDACFLVVEEEKRKAFSKEREREHQKQIMELKAATEARVEELEEEAPSPEEAPLLEAPTPENSALLEAPEPLLEAPSAPSGWHREYILKLYGAPIGVVIDKNEQGKLVYHIVEPQIPPALIEKAKELYGKDLAKDNSLFDNATFMATVAEKAAKKTKEQFPPFFAYGIRYYLERDILGAKKFDPFLYDENVKAVFCEGSKKRIRIEHKDLGILESNIMIEKNEDINELLKRIASATGKTVDSNHPILEATFQGLHFVGVIGVGGENSRLTIRRLEA